MDKKYDPGNTTGAYELDPSLVGAGPWQNAWRSRWLWNISALQLLTPNRTYLAMNVNDEIFCSAGLILPDKTGRLLNIGGWSDQALYGIRLYTPSGSLGVTGNTDWQADYNNAVLQVCYPNYEVHLAGSNMYDST